MKSLKYIFFLLSSFIVTGFAKADYLREDDLESFVVSCYLENEIPVELALQEVGFKIIKKECFKRHFYFVAEK